MRALLALATLALPVPLLAAGVLSQFDSRPPVAHFVSIAALDDIERCMIDLSGMPAPHVYRQPDRPQQVTLLWDGAKKARADLRMLPTGTEVVLWLKSGEALICAPKAGN